MLGGMRPLKTCIRALEATSPVYPTAPAGKLRYAIQYSDSGAYSASPRAAKAKRRRARRACPYELPPAPSGSRRATLCRRGWAVLWLLWCCFAFATARPTKPACCLRHPCLAPPCTLPSALARYRTRLPPKSNQAVRIELMLLCTLSWRSTNTCDYLKSDIFRKLFLSFWKRPSQTRSTGRIRFARMFYSTSYSFHRSGPSSAKSSFCC